MAEKPSKDRQEKDQEAKDKEAKAREAKDKSESGTEDYDAAVRETRGEGSIPGVGKRTEEVAVKGQGDVKEGEHSNEEITAMPTPEALKASGATVGDPTEGPSS